MAQSPPPRDESFFARLTRLFRSGPSIRRKIRGYNDIESYDKKAILAAKPGNGNGMVPFRKGTSQSNPFSMLGGSDIMSRINRYMEFGEMEYSLHPDTKIAIPGGYKTIKELADECKLNSDHKFFVYSYDHNKKKLVLALGQAARVTCHEEACAVTFDNGTKLVGSLNHRLMRRDGTYTEIQDLKPGDAMMPFYRKDLFSKDLKDAGPGYRWIYTIGKGEDGKSGWKSEHRLVAEALAGRALLKNEVVHHKNFCAWDNQPENLEIMTQEDHRRLHCLILNGKKWDKEKNGKWIEEFKEKHSEWMKKNNPSERKDINFWSILHFCEKDGFNLRKLCGHFDTDPNTIKRKLRFHGFENFQTFAKAYQVGWQNNGFYKKDTPSARLNRAVTFQSICSIFQKGMTLREVSQILGVSSMIPISRVKANGFAGWSDFAQNYKNLKVSSVTKLPGKLDLYDLTVDGYKNFATDSVISHNTPIISKALDIQADESCSGDENGKNFHVYSNNQRVKETLEELFYDILNVDFNLRSWTRNLLKYGDLFLYNDVAPGIGIVNCMAMNVAEVERDEGYDANDPYAVRFRWNKLGQKTLENWQVTHFRINGNDQFAPYGISILESARRIWRQYVMMLDAMLVYRLVRAPERRVFYVDVGTVAPNDIPNYMQTVMATIRGTTSVNKETGQMDERFNPTDVLEDYVIPVRGANSGTKIDSLVGGANQTATEDIEIIQSQLFAALGVPKAFLGFDESLSCFTADTKVALLDGRALTMPEIKEELALGKELWTYSIDQTKNNRLVPGKITNAWCAKKVVKLVTVTLDNNQSFTCTPEHMWMDRDGFYKKAESLTPGTALMPFYVKNKQLKQASDYQQVFNPASQKKNSKVVNRKVLAIKFLEVDPTDVWDITVDTYHNFSLFNGVFVKNSKATLAQEDIRFSKSIQIIQKIIISELNKLAILHLYAKGFDGEDLIDFELRLSNPSSIALQQKLDLWKTKIDIIAAVDQIETRFLPMNWLYKEILGFTKDEIKDLQNELKKDKRFLVELDAITEPEETGKNSVDPFDGSTYGLPSGSPVSANSLPPNTDANGIFDPTSTLPTEGEPFRFSVGDQTAPIKDNPQVRMDKKNQARRRSGLEKQAAMPDFRKMLHPSQNRSLKDIYDSEFLKNPIQEAMKRDLQLGITKEVYLSREMRSMLEKFDRSARIQKNELPLDIQIIVEEQDAPLAAKSIEEVNRSDMDQALQNVMVEEQAPGDELDEIILESRPAPSEDNLPNLKELAELGLDLKEPQDSEDNS